jgi:integral membrane protein (TIGR01906 family)
MKPRAPVAVGLALGLAVALLIALIGPLLLFNPWFTSYLQARNDVPARLGTTRANVDRITGSILCDLVLSCGGDFGERLPGASGPLLTDAERSHMRDVGRLVRNLWIAVIGSLIVGVLAALRLRRERRRIGGLLLRAAAAIGVLAVVLGALFAIAFDQMFLAFHELFFPQGNFAFGPDSNLLRLFPEGFWFDAALAAGTTIVLTAVAVTAIGWRLTRPPGEPAAV